MRALLLAALVLLVASATASAATYEVDACTAGGGSGVNRLFAAYGASGSCSGGYGLSTRLSPVLPPFSYSSEVMTAPPGTTISGYSVGWNVWWSSQVNGGYGAFIDGNDGRFLSWPCTWAGCTVGMPPSGPASTGWVRSERHDVDLSMLRLGIQCGGSWCTDGYVEAAWSDIHVELSDRSAPAVTAGRLDGWTARPRTVAYSASDNSGIRRTRVYLDGALHSADTRSCDYSYRVPCSDASGSFTADPGELADGTHTFEVRALDATDSNTGSSGVTSFLVDSHGPTVEAGGQGSPGSWQPGPVTVTLSARDGASGMGAADDGQPLESGGYITYSLDGGTPRTASGDHAGVEVAGDGTHTLTFSAHDVAGNVSAEHTVTIRVGTPAERLAGPGAGFSAHASNAASTFSAARSFAGACPAEATLTPLRDTYVDQSRPDAANGGAAALTVRSAQGANARALLAFALPAADGCEVASARLRVYATSASDGRTITALRLASAWDDAAAWLTRPGAAGPGATVPSGAGWIAFDVTDQLRDVYRYGDSGLMLRDLAESGAAAAAQQYASSEDGQGRRPELTVSFQ